MQSPKRIVPNLVFGIYFSRQFSALESLKSSYLWLELQADKDVENRFWIDDVEYPNVLLIEVAIDRSVDLTQIYLSYWRSFDRPIIWIIEDDISHEFLNHPTYNQLTKNISLAGECILNQGAVSDYSVTTIAKNLLNRFYSQSQPTTFSNASTDCTIADFAYGQRLGKGHDRSVA